MHPSPVLQRAIRRLPLNTKQGPHNFYKGHGTGAMGEHTKYGSYRIDWKKVRTYLCPDLTDFNLTPFVAKRIEPRRDNFAHTETKGPMDGKEYLRRWKMDGGRL